MKLFLYMDRRLLFIFIIIPFENLDSYFKAMGEAAAADNIRRFIVMFLFICRKRTVGKFHLLAVPEQQDRLQHNGRLN